MVVTLPLVDLVAQLKKADATAKVDDKAVKKVAGIMVDTIVHSKAAGAVAGINLFDNVLWFNQELMTEALWYAVAVPAYLGDGLAESTKEGLEAVEKMLATAQKKAEYRADQLCVLLPPPEVKKPATKAGAKSAKASKSAAKAGAKATKTKKTTAEKKADSKAEKKD